MSVRHQNTLKYLILLDLTFCMLLLHECVCGLFTFKYTGTIEETVLTFQKHKTLSTRWLKMARILFMMKRVFRHNIES